jgi:hypothetical protein
MNFLEGADGILEGHELALVTGEDLGNLEGLRHEPLNFASPLDLSWNSINLNVGS